MPIRLPALFRPLAVPFALVLLMAGAAHAGPLNVKSAILMDVSTGRIMYEQHPDRRIQPASLTKVLSLYVAHNAISAHRVDYTNKVKVSRTAAATGGSRMGLKAGDQVTLEKLFYGMAVPSGNDASVAVAEHVSGSTAAFVKEMNALARRLGMKNSHFVNVNGLPDQRQYTTARDMLKLARSYQACYPRSRRFHLAPTITHNGHTQRNHNPLVGSYSGLLGLKTGWVNAAGYNIIASAKRNGHTLIAVIMGAPNTGVRTAEIRRLLDAGFKTLGQKPAATAKFLGVSPAQAAQLKKS